MIRIKLSQQLNAETFNSLLILIFFILLSLLHYQLPFHLRLTTNSQQQTALLSYQLKPP